MGRRAESYIRKITRVGQKSLSVVIPAEIVDELKLRERQKLVIKRVGKRISIEDWPASPKRQRGEKPRQKPKKKE